MEVFTAHVPDAREAHGCSLSVPVRTFEITSESGPLRCSRYDVYYKDRDWINGMLDIDGCQKGIIRNVIDKSNNTTMTGFTEPQAKEGRNEKRPVERGLTVGKYHVLTRMRHGRENFRVNNNRIDMVSQSPRRETLQPALPILTAYPHHWRACTRNVCLPCPVK